jgi:hypothetical protein
MFIEMQERKMIIQIFGENPLDCSSIKKKLKNNTYPSLNNDMLPPSQNHTQSLRKVNSTFRAGLKD